MILLIKLYKKLDELNEKGDYAALINNKKEHHLQRTSITADE